MKSAITVVVFLIAGLFIHGALLSSYACTGIKVKTEDGSVVTGLAKYSILWPADSRPA